MNEIQKVELGYILPKDLPEDQHRELCAEVIGYHDMAQEAVKVCQFQIGDLYNSITFEYGDRAKYVKSVWPSLNPKYVKLCANVAKMAPLSNGISKFHLEHHSQTGDAIAQTSVRSDAIPFTLYVEALKNTKQDQFEEAVKWAIQGIEKPAGNFRKPTVAEMREHVRELTGYVKPIKVTSSTDEEFKRAMNILPARTSVKALKEYQRIIGVLKTEYTGAVKKGVVEQVKEEQARLNASFKMANERKADYEDRIASVPSLISREEFKMVVSCLHPDRHPDEEAKYGKALEIFNRLVGKVDWDA